MAHCGGAILRMSFPSRSSGMSSHSGQSLIETALLLPLLLVLIFNAINFAYYFLVGIHLASAPREGVQYSIMGFETPGQLDLPFAPAINTLTRTDITAISDSGTATVRVCTNAGGLGTSGTGSATVANCATFGAGGAFTGPAADPEAPLFLLNRVDVQYTVTPLINAAPFGLPVLPSYTFTRQVSMRQM